MNDTISLQTYLLMRLAEEAAEVTQAVSKCVLYSPRHTAPECDKTNLQNLEAELNDLLGTLRVLRATGLNVRLSNRAQYEKAVKIARYAEISANIGTLKQSSAAIINGCLGNLRSELEGPGAASD